MLLILLEIPSLYAIHDVDEPNKNKQLIMTCFILLVIYPTFAHSNFIRLRNLRNLCFFIFRRRITINRAASILLILIDGGVSIIFGIIICVLVGKGVQCFGKSIIVLVIYDGVSLIDSSFHIHAFLFIKLLVKIIGDTFNLLLFDVIVFNVRLDVKSNFKKIEIFLIYLKIKLG